VIATGTVDTFSLERNQYESIYWLIEYYIATMVMRRTLLGTAATAAICGVAGCIGGDGDPGTFSRFETEIEDTNIDTVEVTYDSETDRATVSYVPRQAGNEDALADEIGTIMGVFFDQVDAGWDINRLDGALLSGDEEPVAEWYAEAEWYDQLQANELTPNELSIRVLNTLSPIAD